MKALIRFHVLLIGLLVACRFGGSFESLWQRREEFAVPAAPEEPEESPNLCAYGRQFAGWTEELCAPLSQQLDLVAINQRKVLLLDKYWEWYRVVPIRHRSLSARGGKHTCIFAVFEAAYNQLKVAELVLTPPMLFLPQPPSPPPAPQISGIFLGEVER